MNTRPNDFPLLESPYWTKKICDTETYVAVPTTKECQYCLSCPDDPHRGGTVLILAGGYLPLPVCMPCFRDRIRHRLNRLVIFIGVNENHVNNF